MDSFGCMAVIKVPTSFNIDLEFEIPEFYRRLSALAIDAAILFCYKQIANRLIRAYFLQSSFNDDLFYNIWGLSNLLNIPIILYFLISEITMNGQSVGKKIMGLRVVNENGGKASLSQFFIRWIFRDTFLFTVVAVLIITAFSTSETGIVLALLSIVAYYATEIILVVSSKKGQRIGDILARTIVIRLNTKASIEETVFQEVADTYTPQFPQIMRLSDRDINAIKNILETARKKGDLSMAAAASDKIKSHLNIDTVMDPYEFLAVLLKDYNYLSVK